MGIYIETPGAKFKWLVDNSVDRLDTPVMHDNNHFTICAFVNNGFIAAGVCDSEETLEYWKHSEAGDDRPRFYFKVNKDVVKPFINAVYYPQLYGPS